MNLFNRSKDLEIASQIEEAKTFSQRLVGNLGKHSLQNSHGLWIHDTNSIHTFFMKFPLDLIFLDRSLKVKKVYRNVKPWRLIWPVLGAKSVVELNGGYLEPDWLEEGDQLDVGS